MKRKWYAVYTKANCEFKVLEALTQKKFEGYIPQNKNEVQGGQKNKTQKVPLFPSIVFVKTEEEHLAAIKKLKGVINVLYWLDKPAVIRDVEIEMMMQFLKEHQVVQLQKTIVNVNNMVRIVTDVVTDHPEQLEESQYNNVKLSLPSLGYNLISTISKAKVKVGYIQTLKAEII